MAEIINLPEESFWVRNYFTISKILRFMLLIFFLLILLSLITLYLDGYIIDFFFLDLELQFFKNLMGVRFYSLINIVFSPLTTAFFFLISIVIPFYLLSKFSVYAFAPFEVKSRAKKLLADKKVVGELSQNLSHDYILLNQLRTSREAGKKEIDHLVLGNSGVFVISTLVGEGIIETVSERTWCEKVNDKRTKFYNPVKSNQKRIKSLKNQVQEVLSWIEDIQFKSIVVFPEGVDISAVREKAYSEVILINQLIDYIKEHEEVVLDKKQKEELLETLKELI